MSISATNISTYLKNQVTAALASFDPNNPTAIDEDFLYDAIGVAVATEVNNWITVTYNKHVHVSPFGGNTGLPIPQPPPE